jgi:NADPH-dependent glutamate synthase beta subunit-like oxidoreductase
MGDEKYRVEVVDASYYKRVISCQNACPTRTDARGYVNAVAGRDYVEGYIIARQPNPFASTCGQVCNAPCEAACRRKDIDAPVSIRALKRFLCERYGVEAKGHLAIARAPGEEWGAELLVERTPGNSNTVESLATLLRDSAGKEPGWKRAKVAVIGSGPAGLTAAHDLAALGYKVTIFEAASAPGGMLLQGIPEYRLSRSLIRFEIEEILRRGAELKVNMRLGKDFTLSTLREEGYEAIFIAIGAYKDRSLETEGADLDGVIYSLDFLREANLGYRVTVGNKVLVIGGGGTAIDAARTMLRVGDGVVEKDGVAALDAARGALRLGAREVHIIYRGARWEMRAPDEEIEDAVEEGVFLHTNRAPNRILGEGGKVTGMETIRVQSEVDEEGRRVRTFVPGSEEVLEGDTVIVAIGQGSDLSFIRKEDGIQVTKEDTIAVDPETLATTAPGVFAGGDVAFGPRIIIEAVKDGHRAARAIDRYLQKGKASILHRATLREVAPGELPAEGCLDIPKRRPPLLPLERRTGVSEVEMVYDEEVAVEQASRCLRCHIQTVFNGDLCILCGGCVDVCPQNCFKMVRLDKIQGDKRFEALIQARYGISLEAFQKGGEALSQGTAMIKDEARCVRCGLCAQRCPVGAITMEAFWFEEILTYEGNGKGEEVSIGGKV